jgi:hypothetical protein
VAFKTQQAAMAKAEVKCQQVAGVGNAPCPSTRCQICQVNKNVRKAAFKVKRHIKDSHDLKIAGTMSERRSKP